jgi:secreted PhoX family phosphatase
MAGIPDGLGAYDNGNGTITVLMNHELAATLGIQRAHGALGAFVSEWVINKDSLAVSSGADLIKSVYTYANSIWTPTTVAFNRFCSADLAAVSAFYNSASGKGSQARIFLNGDESVSTTVASKGVAHVATGADKGKTYVLPWATMTNVGWENLLANPSTGDKTVVMANSDGGFNGVYLYVGSKATTGNEVEKAGLIGGTMYRVLVNNALAESTAANAGLGLVGGAGTFTLSTDLTTAAGGTSFLRPEDGLWDTTNASRYYFATTNTTDAAKDGNTNTDITAGQVGRTRVWRMTFTDIARPHLGGIIEMMLDGTETLTVNGRTHGPQMLDNMTMTSNGDLILLEDVGFNKHNGKIWKFVPGTKVLTLLAQHDEVRFGDYFTNVTGTLTKDEESSGVIDVTSLLGRNDGRTYFLLAVQNHATATGANAAELAEGGQLLLMSY